MARVANDRRSRLLPGNQRTFSERRTAGISFLLTCISVFFVYFVGWQPDGDGLSLAAARRSTWFTLSLMSILLAHEMGHWLAARLSGFRISLPVFIPFPFLVGTLGAIIRMEQSPRDRSSLLRMGAAGPLAGFGVTVILMAARLGFDFGSENLIDGGTSYDLSIPAVWTIVCVWFGVTNSVISPFDPVAFGVWIGCMVTAMNLLPFGQLDGGHITNGFLSSRGSKGLNLVVTMLLLLGGLLWFGWLVWAGILWLIRADRGMEISSGANMTSFDKGLAVASALCFALCFTPIPFRLLG